MKLRQGLILLSALASILMGCAHEQVILNSDKTDLLKNFKDQYTTVDVQSEIALDSFQDVREDKESVGVAKTGALNKDAPLVTDISLDAFMKKRVQEALMKRKVLINVGAAYVLKGKIKKLWITENTGMMKESSRCELQLDLDLYSAKSEKLAYHSAVWADITGSNSPLDATDSDGPALNTCIDYAVEKFLSNKEVLSLINKKGA